MKLLVAMLLAATAAATASAQPKTVHFLSGDQKTQLTGYLFIPGSGPAPHPAVVMLHGRAGPYSSLAKGVYSATTLSKRHKEWGEFWAARGYYALLVDSFAPRGYPEGFGKGSYKDRPPEVSEQTVRPLDAYGALRYLRRHSKEVNGDRIGVQGWSNGGMTVLVTMSDRSPGIVKPGFRAAIAEYPGCGMDAVSGAYHAYAPVELLIAGSDEEVSPTICQDFGRRAKAAGSDIRMHVYPGAEHNYDDPGTKKQSVPANRHATEDTMRRAEAFFRRYLIE